MENFYLGIDAGGTRYNLIAINSAGKKLFQCGENALHINVAGLESFSYHISETIKSVLAKRKFSINQCKGICMGVAGARFEKDREKLRKSLKSLLGINNIIIETDTEIARYGVFGGEGGILLICGTGSILYGKINNTTFRIGGWGKILGDEGSGYKIGLEALKILIKEFDLKISNSNLAKALKRKFNITQENLIEKVYRKNFNIQELAPLILELAKDGNRDCMKILNNAVFELIELIKKFFKISNLKKTNLVLSGGIIENNEFFSKILRMKIINSLENKVEIVSKKYSPEFGAYLIAKSKFK
jgi:N-acetylglucosamine kinase-like BadF-type ATPase